MATFAGLALGAWAILGDMSVTSEPTQVPPSHRAPGPRRGTVVGAAVATAVVSAIGLVVVTYLALHTSRGQELDDRAMRVFSVNGEPDAVRPLLRLLSDISIGSAGLAMVAFVVLALLRRGFTLAVAAAALVAGANVTTQLLKHAVLTRPDLDYGTLNSLPSGHTTLIFSLALAAMLVAPVRLRRVVSVAAAAVGTLAAVATVVAGWHRPADVVASMLVTLTWGAIVVAILVLLGSELRPHPHRAHEAFALVGSVVAVVLLVAWGVGPGPGPGEMVAAVLALGSVTLASAVAVGGFARLLDHAVG